MNTIEIIPNHRLTHADLLFIAANLSTKLKQDFTELSTVGLQQTEIDDLDTQIQDWANTPTDDELQLDVNLATEVKKQLRERVMLAIRDFSTAVILVFGRKSIIYARYEVGEMTIETDQDLYFTARRVARLTQQYLPELAVRNVTQAMIDTLKTLTNQYLEALEAIETAAELRSDATRQRTLKGNTLYSLTVLLSELGKQYWATRNFVKHEQYVIYG